MRLLTAVWVGMYLTISVTAQNHTREAPNPATLMTGLGDLHHPVSTKNTEAQQFFDHMEEDIKPFRMVKLKLILR